MSDRCRAEFERWLREAFGCEFETARRETCWIVWQAAWSARDRGRFKSEAVTFERASEFSRALETE